MNREEIRVRDLMQRYGKRGVFVYGANTAGRHGAGAARVALIAYGAEYGKIGWVGQSYGIPTKDIRLKTRTLANIAISVSLFLDDVDASPDYEFVLTRIGCGLAGYQDSQIAPLFKGVRPNLHKPEGW